MTKPPAGPPAPGGGKRFLTDIPEPRWQQIVSVLLVLGLAALWLWGVLS